MKLTYMDNGHYRVSDADAGRLAADAQAKVPRPGYELRVDLPSGWGPAWLKRTPHRHHNARGWVWAVMPDEIPYAVRTSAKWAKEKGVHSTTADYGDKSVAAHRR